MHQALKPIFLSVFIGVAVVFAQVAFAGNISEEKSTDSPNKTSHTAPNLKISENRISLPTTCSDDDIYEPNDSSSDSKSLSFNTNNTNLLLCGPNLDYFHFTLPANAIGVVQLSSPYAIGGATGRIVFSVLDSQGKGFGGGRTTLGNTTPKVYIPTSPINEIYTISIRHEVSTFPNDHNYDLNIFEASPCIDDIYEPNSWETPSIISLNDAPFSLMSCLGREDDYYKVTIPPNTAIQIDLTYPPNISDLSLYVYEEGGTFTSGGGKQVIFQNFNNTPSIYGINISNIGENHNAYDLSLKPISPITACVDDRFENNDRNSSSTIPNLNLPSITYDLMSCLHDQDFFKVSVPANAEVRVDLTFKHSDDNLQLKVHKPNYSFYSVIAVADSINDNEVILFTNNESETIDYLISVNNEDHVGYAPYSLKLSTIGHCDDDSFEENDTISTATPITLGDSPYTNLISCIDDYDFYSLTVPAQQSVAIDLLFEHDISDLDLSIIDPPSGYPYNNSVSSTDNEQIYLTNNASSDQTYYIRVGNFRTKTGHAPYELHINSPPACTDDLFENNDSVGFGSSVLPIPSSIDSLIHCLGDDDYYEITVADGDTIQVDIEFTHETADLHMWFYVQQNVNAYQSFAFVDTTSDNETYSFTNNEGITKKYVVKISRNGNINPAPYRLNIKNISHQIFIPIVFDN